MAGDVFHAAVLQLYHASLVCFSFSCYLSDISSFFVFLVFPWNHFPDVAFNSWPPLLFFVVISVCCHLGYFYFYFLFSREQLLSQSPPPRWPLLLRLYHFSSLLIQPAGCSFSSPVSTDRPEMDAHWSFVARKKARARLMSFPLLPFSAPLFFFFFKCLSFLSGWL